MAFIKSITEKGIIISKRFQEAKQARTDMNGKEWPATDEKFLIEVISCDEDDFNKETGILKKRIHLKEKFIFLRCIPNMDKGRLFNLTMTDLLSVRRQTF